MLHVLKFLLLNPWLKKHILTKYLYIFPIFHSILNTRHLSGELRIEVSYSALQARIQKIFPGGGGPTLSKKKTITHT